MKIQVIAVGLLLCLGHLAIGQSKKELAAEVEQLRQQAGLLKQEVDSLRGATEIALDDKHQKASYGLGVLVGGNLKTQGGDSLDVDALCAGLQDVMLDQPLKIEKEEAMTVVQQYMQEAMELKSTALQQKNKAFLEDNKLREGVTTTVTGLQYEILKEGSGKSPGPDDSVRVHYTGTLIDGTVFDSSLERNEPITFVVGEVIPGWAEALLLMQEGDKWKVYVPSQLAYGERGAGQDIPPHSTLIFDIELLEVFKTESKE